MPDYERATGPGSRLIWDDRTCLIGPSLRWMTSIAVSCFLAATSGYGQEQPNEAAATVAVAQAQEIVAKATLGAVRWSGPQAGPPAQRGKNIALVAEDLRNGGIVGVAQGAREAASAMGWTLKIFDGAGSASGRAKAFSDALAAKPDGLILCGSDALENNAALMRFADKDIPVVGWHAGVHPGPIDGTPVAMNVTSDPLEVARLTAMAAVAQSNGQAGVVILTDSKYSIAMTKAKAMEDVIRACQGCSMLEVRDVAISESSEKMPAVTRELLQRYGKRWTHTGDQRYLFRLLDCLLDRRRDTRQWHQPFVCRGWQRFGFPAHPGENLPDRYRRRAAQPAWLASHGRIEPVVCRPASERLHRADPLGQRRQYRLRWWKKIPVRSG